MKTNRGKRYNLEKKPVGALVGKPSNNSKVKGVKLSPLILKTFEKIANESGVSKNSQERRQSSRLP